MIEVMKRAITLLIVAAGGVCGQQPDTLQLKGRIDLPNVDGRIDHFTADVKGQRVFLSALGNRTVEILEMQTGKRVRTIADLAEPQGVLYDPSTNRLFVACAKDGATKLFDAGTLRMLEVAKFS